MTNPAPEAFKVMAPSPNVVILAAAAPERITLKESKDVTEELDAEKLKEPLPKISTFSPSSRLTTNSELMVTLSWHVRVPSLIVSLVNTAESKMGLVLRTTLPSPVDRSTPVPPLMTGNGIPEYSMSKVPDEVMGDPETVRKSGVVNAIEVTVPVVGVVHNKFEPFDVNTWLLDPTVSSPVPPLDVESGSARVIVPSK